MMQRSARPDDDYVPPERQETQLEHIPTGSDGPPLPPPPTIKQPQSPPTHTIPPRSLPAGARAPKHGQRAYVQSMANSSSSGDNPGPMSGLVSRLSSWLAPSASSPPTSEDASAHSGRATPKSAHDGWATPMSWYVTATTVPPTPKRAKPSYPWPYSHHVAPIPPPPPTRTVEYSIATPPHTTTTNQIQ